MYKRKYIINTRFIFGIKQTLVSCDVRARFDVDNDVIKTVCEHGNNNIEVPIFE